MTTINNAPRVVAGIVAAAIIVWFSGCGNGDDSQYQEYSQLSSATAVAETDVTDKTPDSEDNSQNVTIVSEDANVQGGTDIDVQPRIIAQLPIEAPLPPIADSDDGTGKISDSEPLAVVRTDDQPPLVPSGRNPADDGRTNNPNGDVGKPLSPVVPREVKLLVKERKFKVEGPIKAVRVNYDDLDLLKVLNMEPVTVDAPKLMPAWLKGLDGKRIRIRGFMYPAFQETGIPAFLMARDNQICCFGGEAKIYDLFPVRMRKGVTTDYILNRPFDVVGVFHIDTIVDEGELFQLYRIDDAVVIDK